jgi:DNA-directed RNA polymerase subunit M/transcription elongation factor TFIIS
MSDTQKQFIAACPKCSASMKVGFNRLGQNVDCPRCHYTFVAGETAKQPAQPTDDRGARSSSTPADQVDRVAAVCPGCQATLHVRRAYVGNQVRCKFCDQVFRVLAPAEIRPNTETNLSANDRDRLQAEHEELYVAHNLLQTDHERLRSEHATLQAEHDRLQGDHQTLQGDHQRLQAQYDPLRAELDRVKEDLAVLSEQHRSVQDQHASTEERCKEYEDRIRELLAAQERLETLEESTLSSHEPHSVPWRDRPPELHVVSDETGEQFEPAKTAVLELAGDQPMREAEVDDLRAQLTELRILLEESEHVNREMGAVLSGMGIRYQSTNR